METIKILNKTQNFNIINNLFFLTTEILGKKSSKEFIQ